MCRYYELCSGNFGVLGRAIQLWNILNSRHVTLVWRGKVQLRVPININITAGTMGTDV